MPVVLISVKFGRLFLVMLLVSLANMTTKPNEGIKRSFRVESPLSSLTVTVSSEDAVTSMDRLDDNDTTTIESSLVAIAATEAPRPPKRVSSSPVSVLNHCLSRLLNLRFLGSLLVFAAIISLFSGPFFGLRVLLFSIQFNIVFPTFVCFISEFFNRNSHQAKLT